VDLDEVLRPGHRQHRLDALLNARQLEMSAAAADLTVEIHQAADRGAVDVGDRREIDQDLAPPCGEEASDRCREVRQDRIHQPRFGDPDNGHGAGLLGGDVHE
jgi:hypothetical protein